MVNPQGTSFIPQRPTHGKSAPRKVRKIYVLAYLSYVIFFGALISAAGIFFMNFSLNAQLESQRQKLASERELFNEADIESIRDLEKRIGIAQERLNKHVSVLAILEALEVSAVRSLYFESFTYEREGDEFPKVVFGGTSDQFNNILFQREVLATNPILAGSNFKEVGIESRDLESGDEVRTVQFELEKEIDTSLIGYTPRNLQIPGQEQNQTNGMENNGTQETQQVSVDDFEGGGNTVFDEAITSEASQ